MGNPTQRYVQEQLKKRFGLLPTEARKAAGKILEQRIDRPNTASRRPIVTNSSKKYRSFYAA